MQRDRVHFSRRGINDFEEVAETHFGNRTNDCANPLLREDKPIQLSAVPILKIRDPGSIKLLKHKTPYVKDETIRTGAGQTSNAKILLSL